MRRWDTSGHGHSAFIRSITGASVETQGNVESMNAGGQMPW